MPASGEIDYTPNSVGVVIPVNTDEESEWVECATKAVELMKAQKSLAFATIGSDFVDTDKALNIEKVATSNMTGKQLESYKAWKNNELELPEWDWSNTATIAEKAKTKNDWSAKAAAIQRIYGKSDISNEQAKAWVLGNWPLHALWKAVTHVVRAERAACGGHQGKDPLAFCEAVACRKLHRRLACHTYGKSYDTGKDTDVFAELSAQLENRLKIVDGALKN